MFASAAYFTGLPHLPAADELQGLAARLFGQVFRFGFAAPGAALVRIEGAVNSFDLRRLMVALKLHLSAHFHAEFGRQLIYLSMGRFDQKNTTKFHLDGAPDESFLMLGYEPSRLASALAIADYVRAAVDLGIEPRRFLTDYNPLFRDGERRLAPYITRLTAFEAAAYQILLVNNSSLPFADGGRNQLGVMHQATMLTADNTWPRIVNSTMLGTALDPAAEMVPHAVQEAFMTSNEVAGKLY